MTLDELTSSLFEDPQAFKRERAILYGRASLKGGPEVEVIGIHGGATLGIEDALTLAGRVLDLLEAGEKRPILAIVDGSSQRMSKRDELLGLNEYLAHLGKTLLFAQTEGARSIGLIYGGAAAGAFIAAALSTGEVIAVEGAHPEVMDLPSMSKVTKLPLEVLKQKAEATPVFAPGIQNLVKVGAVTEVWKASDDLANKLVERLAIAPLQRDARDELGKTHGGRTKAAEIARRVQDAAHVSS